MPFWHGSFLSRAGRRRGIAALAQRCKRGPAGETHRLTVTSTRAAYPPPLCRTACCTTMPILALRTLIPPPPHAAPRETRVPLRGVVARIIMVDG